MQKEGEFNSLYLNFIIFNKTGWLVYEYLDSSVK